MSSLRLAMKQSLEVASAEGVVVPKKVRKVKGIVKPVRSKSAHDGHHSDSSEENEASLQDLDESPDSSDEEDGKAANETMPDRSGSNKNHQLNQNTAAHKIQSQFRKKKDKKSEGAATGKLRTKKLKKKRRSDDLTREMNAGKEDRASAENGATTPREPDDDNGNSSEESEVWTVAPPSEAVIKHMASLSNETCRRTVTIGLRVKVHFDRSAWYGGRVSDVSKDGSEIRIRYDDGTREDSPFPDTSKKGSVDIVVDAVQNGQHSSSAAEAARVFLPRSTAPATMTVLPTPTVLPSEALQPPSTLEPEFGPSLNLNLASARNDPQPEQTPALPVYEAEPMAISTTDSTEDGELIEPYVVPIQQPAIQPSVSNEGTKPVALAAQVDHKEVAEGKPEAVALLMITAGPNNVSEASSGDGTDPTALSLSQNDDGMNHVDDAHLDDETVADDGLAKAKRKRGRPPKRRPSDATDMVESEDTVHMEAATTELPSTHLAVDVGDAQEASQTEISAAPDRDSVETVRVVVPSLKIRMPKASGEMGLKSPKSPRTPRSPPLAVSHDVDASLQNVNADPIASQKKRPLDEPTSVTDQPPAKKLSIRIPIHKVRPALQSAEVRSPRDSESNEVKDVAGTEPIVDVASPRFLLQKATSNSGAGDSKESGSVSQPNYVAGASTELTPMSPKQIKKLKKKKLLLAAAASKLALEQPDGVETPTDGTTFTTASETVQNMNNPPDVGILVEKRIESEVAETEEYRSPFFVDELGDFAMDGPIRSERRAAQQANERIVAKQDSGLPIQPAGKKKKKRDRQKDAEGVSPPGIEETEDDSQWAQCDKCGKWRVIPSNVVKDLPKQWYCTDNTYDPSRASCDAPEQTAKELAKEKKKRLKKRQRMMKAAEAQEQSAVEDSATPNVDNKLVEPPVRKEKLLELVKSPRPSRDVPEEMEKPPKQPKRTVLDEETVARGDTANEVRSKKEKKTLGKKGRVVEPVEKAAPEEVATPAEVVKPRGRGRPRRNQGKESTAEPGQPVVDDPDNLEWVQCEKCNKWRKLPPHVSADDLPDIWTCNLNDWNPMSASCDAPEDQAEGLQDIGVFGSSGATAGKLTYRHLIFGSTGRKANRPITERTRAAESIFATQFDEEEAPSKVLYSDSSCYVYRGRSNASADDGCGMSMLELMSHSHLWQELRGENQTIGNNLLNSQLNVNGYTFDTLPLDIQRSIKDFVLHVMDFGTFSGDDILNMTKETSVDALPEAMRKAYVYCTKNVVITTLCQLVKEGKVDCIQKIRNSWPIRDWNPLYRRVMKRLPLPEVVPPPLPSAPKPQPRKTTPRVSRFMKISKPWKYANMEAKSV